MSNRFHDRIHSAIDVPRLQASHVVIVGTGGSSGFAQHLARCGVDTFTLIDFDRVDESNIGRQDHNADAIGLYKVDVLSERLQAIRPGIEVRTMKENICHFDDARIEAEFSDCDLFAFTTDSFRAQAFGNRLALKLKIPAIWGGLYQHAAAGEIIWWNPNHRPFLPCFRCLVAKRYELQLAAQKKGEHLDPSADGATVIDITILDSLAAYIAIGLLTQGADNRFGRLIDQLGNRNFMQMQLDPLWAYAGKNPIRNRLQVPENNDFFFNWCTTVMADPDQGQKHCLDCEELLGHRFHQIHGDWIRSTGGEPASTTL